MQTLFSIAYRYLFAKKSHNIINIISIISVVVIAIVTMAMVVVLSVFNGIQGLVNNLYSAFDGDLHLSAERGKVFNLDTLNIDFLEASKQYATLSYYIEEDVLLKYRDNQVVATLRGVDSEFIKYTKIDTSIYDGEPNFGTSDQPYALIGGGLRQQLNVPIYGSNFSPLTINSPARGKNLRQQVASNSFLKTPIIPGGAFSINLDFDMRYLITDLSFAKNALAYNENIVSGIELIFKQETNKNNAIKSLKEIKPKGFSLKTKAEKNEILFQTNKAEKWVTFMILFFIMLIGGFNIIASLQMLIIEKQHDIKILKALGFTVKQVRSIFFTQGIFINLFGSIIGLGLGLLICFIQINFGIIELKGGIVPYYPVEIYLSDLLLVFSSVIIVSLASSWIPVKKIVA